jgi:hypothetical protein
MLKQRAGTSNANAHPTATRQAVADVGAPTHIHSCVCMILPVRRSKQRSGIVIYAPGSFCEFVRVSVSREYLRGAGEGVNEDGGEQEIGN